MTSEREVRGEVAVRNVQVALAISAIFCSNADPGPPSLRGAILFPKDSPAPRHLTHESGSCTRPIRNHLKVSHNPSKITAKSHSQIQNSQNFPLLKLQFPTSTPPQLMPSIFHKHLVSLAATLNPRLHSFALRSKSSY
jgi:hypothetical protein